MEFVRVAFFQRKFFACGHRGHSEADPPRVRIRPGAFNATAKSVPPFRRLPTFQVERRGKKTCLSLPLEHFYGNVTSHGAIFAVPRVETFHFAVHGAENLQSACARSKVPHRSELRHMHGMSILLQLRRSATFSSARSEKLLELFGRLRFFGVGGFVAPCAFGCSFQSLG